MIIGSWLKESHNSYGDECGTYLKAFMQAVNSVKEQENKRDFFIDEFIQWLKAYTVSNENIPDYFPAASYTEEYLMLTDSLPFDHEDTMTIHDIDCWRHLAEVLIVNLDDFDANPRVPYRNQQAAQTAYGRWLFEILFDDFLPSVAGKKRILSAISKMLNNRKFQDQFLRETLGKLFNYQRFHQGISQVLLSADAFHR